MSIILYVLLASLYCTTRTGANWFAPGGGERRCGGGRISPLVRCQPEHTGCASSGKNIENCRCNLYRKQSQVDPENRCVGISVRSFSLSMPFLDFYRTPVPTDTPTRSYSPTRVNSPILTVHFGFSKYIVVSYDVVPCKTTIPTCLTAVGQQYRPTRTNQEF